MKQNLLVVSYDYEKSKGLAKKLAESFSMRFFDQRELFEFDHMPRTFSEVFALNGKDYVLKNMRSIVKMELDFDDAVFVADISFADNCYDLFYKIKLSNFVVFLKKDRSEEYAEILAKTYKTEEEKSFYEMSEGLLKLREETIFNDCADITVDIGGLSDEQIIDEIVDKIKNYYSVN